MKIITTNPGRIFEERDIKTCGKDNVRGPVVRLTPERDQEILGFGAALTDSACVLLDKLDEQTRRDLIQEIFAPDQANFSITRVCVGASDYAETVYDYAPVADDLDMAHFDASHDDRTIIPALQAAREANPDLYIFSSPWSPPGWMKSSHVMQGGWMLDRYIEPFTRYYLKFIEYYLSKGVRINALTPQNESETDQQSRMPACYWHPELEMKFAKLMRSLLDDKGFADLRIWLMDHNFIMWHRAVFQMDDAETRQACAGIAWHPYEGHPEQINLFRAKHPTCENHWTEGGMIPVSLGRTLGAPVDRSKPKFAEYGVSFIDGLENGCQSITVWNLALDEEGYPNVGPFNCRGTIEISRDGKRVTRSQEYYCLNHLSRYVKRGARRIICDKNALPNNLSVSAYENPDGSLAVVIANTEQFDSELNLQVGDTIYSLWILRESINTVII